MVYNDQYTNPFSIHENISMENLAAYKLHTKYLPDGLDYSTIYNEQEKMFKYMRNKKTKEIIDKYKDILIGVSSNNTDSVDENDNNNALQNENEVNDNNNALQNEKEVNDNNNAIQNENEVSDNNNAIQNENEVNYNNNAIQNESDKYVANKNDKTNNLKNNTKNSKNYVYECINVLSSALKDDNYSNKILMQDILQLRKMYMYEKQKMLKERILPFLQQNLSNEQLLQSISYKNETNTIKDAIEITEIEFKYIKQQAEKEKQRMNELRKEVSEMHKKQIESENKEYEKIKNCYENVNKIHNSIERKRDDLFVKIRKTKDKEEEQQKRIKYENNNEEHKNDTYDMSTDVKNIDLKSEEENENKENNNKQKNENEDVNSDKQKNKIMDCRIAMLNEITQEKDNKRLRISIFVNLPSKRKYPDYYKTIKQPMSVNVIKNKLKDKKYSIEDMKNDLHTMFDNAIEYNTEESEVYKDAVFYKDFVEVLYKKYNTNEEQNVK